jgi:hypothetical protein
MMIFVFLSAIDRDLVGYTADPSGTNLPPAYAPWEAANQGSAVLTGGEAGPLTDLVRRDGFIIAISMDDAPKHRRVH